MTDNEVNKIIAEFMNWGYKKPHMIYVDEAGFKRMPTESLDALVPVWDKLGSRFSMNYYRESELHCDCNGTVHRFVFCDDLLSDTKETVEAYDLRKAAAHATAKAILELNKEREVR